MVNKLRKSQPKAQEEGSKANMLKRFGGKFKQVFAKKKLSLASKPNEACGTELRHGTTVLLDSDARENERLSIEDRLNVVPSNIQVHEEAQNTHDHASQELPAAMLQKTANISPECVRQDAALDVILEDPEDCAPSTPQQATAWAGSDSPVSSPREMIRSNCNRLVRSLSLPLSPSSPTTLASSATLNNSPGHSDAPSPDSLIKFSQVLQKHRGLSKECHEARFEYLEARQEEEKNGEWLALLKWMEMSHQADVINLKNKHAAEVQQLKQDRSQVRRKLEMKSRELKASKREMKELKETVEELTKKEEVNPPAADSQSDAESRAESVDDAEGGVVLANDQTATTVEAGDGTCGGNPNREDDADLAPKYTWEQKGKWKESTEVTASEEREHQRAPKQQLLDDTTPDHDARRTGANATQLGAIGEAPPNPPPPATTTINTTNNNNNNNNETLQAQIHRLHHHNTRLIANLTSSRRHIARLTSAAATARAEIAQLRASDHFAQIEFQRLHSANVCYRAALEEQDVNPARTAHVDGLLERKDEAYAELEERAGECAEELREERKRREVEYIYNNRHISGLRNELVYRINEITALNASRESLMEQNGSIVRFFRGKIYPDDAIKIILRDYDVLKEDHTRLQNLLSERGNHVLDAEKQLADLQAQAVVNDHAIEEERLTHRATVQSLNGLTVTNNQLSARLEIAAQVAEETNADYEARIMALRHELERVTRRGFFGTYDV